MDSENGCRLTFFTLVQSKGGENCVRLLIDSLRTFGGRFAGCPIWIFHTFPLTLSKTNLKSTNICIFPLKIPESVEGYELSGKVCTCVSAEDIAMHSVRSLVWLDPEYLILKPPFLFDLATSFDAAVRPVHIKNVGSPISQSVDDYWKGIYDAVGVPEVDISVRVTCGRAANQSILQHTRLFSEPGARTAAKVGIAFRIACLRQDIPGARVP